MTVEYAMNQNLFFAGVLGFDGPAAVRTAATAGWGPTGGANPLPIVVYTGNDQGNCDIQEGHRPMSTATSGTTTTSSTVRRSGS